METGDININVLTFSYFKDKDGNEFLAKKSLIAESELIDKPRNKTKRGPSVFKKLFAAGKLKVGDEIIYYPDIEQGIDKNEERIHARIVNTSMKCLKRANENELYSLHAMRSKIVNEFGLKNIRTNWAFGSTYEWGLPDGKRINELIDE